MKVQDVMTIGAKTVSPETTVLQAAGIMKSENIGFLPVIDDNEVVGVVTDRDLVVRALADGSRSNSVREVMSGRPVCCEENADLASAVQLMTQHKIGRLPILDANKKLKGVLSANDVARAGTQAKAVNDLAMTLGDAHASTARNATMPTN
jgi:CBS domain-containing protein